LKILQITVRKSC